MHCCLCRRLHHLANEELTRSSSGCVTASVLTHHATTAIAIAISATATATTANAVATAAASAAGSFCRREVKRARSAQRHAKRSNSDLFMVAAVAARADTSGNHAGACVARAAAHVARAALGRR